MEGKEKTIEERLSEQRARMQADNFRGVVILLDAMKERFGDEVIDILHGVVEKRGYQSGQRFLKMKEKNNIEDLLCILWGNRIDNIEIESSNEGITVRVYKCELYDTACKIGRTDWAQHLMCHDYESCAKSFNPRIGYKRIKSLMKGCSYCEHFYYMKD